MAANVTRLAGLKSESSGSLKLLASQALEVGRERSAAWTLLEFAGYGIQVLAELAVVGGLELVHFDADIRAVEKNRRYGERFLSLVGQVHRDAEAAFGRFLDAQDHSELELAEDHRSFPVAKQIQTGRVGGGAG